MTPVATTYITAYQAVGPPARPPAQSTVRAFASRPSPHQHPFPRRPPSGGRRSFRDRLCLDTVVSRLARNPASLRRMPRDYLAAVRQRVVVFDGGMGATLEEVDLTPADYGGLAGKCHEALVLNRPDVIEGVHASMVDAGAQVVETDTFQASRLKLEEWGLGEHTLEINVKAVEIARRAVGEDLLRRRLDRPDRASPRLGRPDARPDPLPRARRDLRGAGARARPGRRRPHHHRDRAGHPRGQGRDLRRARGVQGRPAAPSRSRARSALLPNGGKMLLGTDIDAVLTTLESLRVDVIGLNCSTGPDDMRDAIRFLGEHSSLPVHCIPNAGLPAAGPGRRDDLPGGARPARRGAR